MQSLQGTAGNRAAAIAIRSVQRDPGPTPNPPGAASISLSDVDPGKLDAAIAGLIGIVRANFVGAVNDARSALITKAIDESTKQTLFQNLTTAVGALVLPSVIALAGEVVRDGLKRTMPTLMVPPLPATATAAEHAANTLNALDAAQAATETFTSSNAMIDFVVSDARFASYVASAQTTLKSKEFDVYGNDKYARTNSYLDGLSDLNSKTMSADALGVLRRSKAESLQLLGSLKYLAEHNEVIRADVTTRATHFLEEVADVTFNEDLSASVVGPQVCKINAYGRDRWARVQVGALAGWVFLRWVDPDAAEALESQYAGKPKVPRLDVSDIAGHLPDPVLESGGQKTPGGEPMRTEWPNAWGGLRLVEVAVPEGLQGTGEYVFRRWIPQAEMDAALARANWQIGGIDPKLPINSDKIRGKTTPTAPPLR